MVVKINSQLEPDIAHIAHIGGDFPAMFEDGRTCYWLYIPLYVLVYVYIYMYIYISIVFPFLPPYPIIYIYIYIYRYIDILSHKATNYSHNWYTQDDAQSRVLLQNCRRRSCRCSLCRGRRCVGIAVCARLPKAGGKGKQWKKKQQQIKAQVLLNDSQTFFRLNSED